MFQEKNQCSEEGEKEEEEEVEHFLFLRPRQAYSFFLLCLYSMVVWYSGDGWVEERGVVTLLGTGDVFLKLFIAPFAPSSSA